MDNVKATKYICGHHGFQLAAWQDLYVEVSTEPCGECKERGYYYEYGEEVLVGEG